ncbi:hypothetical protein H4R19_005332 [Coemansia spiralis]|nr:hypothetical protein H4R19_005332 [Coemansia spiralis]
MFTPSTFTSQADAAPQTAAPYQWGGQGDPYAPGTALVPGLSGTAPTQHVSGPVMSPVPARAGGAGSLDDGDEDMFGFKKSRPAQPLARASTDAPRGKTPSARQSTDTKDGGVARSEAQAGDKESSGVLGMLKSFWGGRKNQANLGDESQFVYDPVQQRWVDKNATGDQADSGAPPPPPPPAMMRFQPTAQGSAPPSYPLGPPPGLRTMSAAPPSLSADPSRTGTPMSTPDMASLARLPPASTGAGAGKRRNARSRYVDLLGQQ